MLTLVALVVCQVKVVDWPGSRVFGFADSEAVGAVIDGGGGGGGGAAFLAHAPRNRMVPRANANVLHLAIVALVVLIFIARITDSSFLCARVVAAISSSRQGALWASRKVASILERPTNKIFTTGSTRETTSLPCLPVLNISSFSALSKFIYF